MAKINTINSSHKLFQQRLSQLADPPKKVYCLGDISAADAPMVAIVGSRKPTPYGEEMTHRLAYDLARQGAVIVSGLAIGIDGIAHRAALEAGGRTIAVLAGGLEQIYPYRHHKLAAQIIAQGGALLSEYEPAMPCLLHQFVARNRIVAALGDGVIVTEAAAKSGSLHTANFALELGRTVMAVPGLATNPLAAGCLNLIKTGAALVANAKDACFALGYQTGAATPTQQLLLADSAEEYTLLQLLQQGISDGEALLAASQLEPHAFGQALSMLEISGRIKALGGNRWVLGD